LLTEGVIRGVAEKVVHAFLPYASLHSVDDGGHAPVKFAGHVDRERIFIHDSSVGRTIHNILRMGQGKALSLSLASLTLDMAYVRYRT
jgi:hypothetical protein